VAAIIGVNWIWYEC